MRRTGARDPTGRKSAEPGASTNRARRGEQQHCACGRYFGQPLCSPRRPRKRFRCRVHHARRRQRPEPEPHRTGVPYAPDLSALSSLLRVAFRSLHPLRSCPSRPLAHAAIRSAATRTPVITVGTSFLPLSSRPLSPLRVHRRPRSVSISRSSCAASVCSRFLHLDLDLHRFESALRVPRSEVPLDLRAWWAARPQSTAAAYPAPLRCVDEPERLRRLIDRPPDYSVGDLHVRRPVLHTGDSDGEIEVPIEFERDYPRRSFRPPDQTRSGLGADQREAAPACPFS